MNKTKRIAVTALLAAVIAIIAPFSFPIGVVPISLATLAVYVAAGALDWKTGTAAVVIYILIGAAGVPVFSSFTGGLQHILGATGGFIIGYIPLAFASGIITDKFSSKKIAFFCGNIIGTLLCYACGTVWFMVVTNNGIGGALSVCVLPFLPFDALKIIVAGVVNPKIRQALAKQK